MTATRTTNRLVEYLATACTSTGQATFYNTREEQAAALAGLHLDVLAEDRRAYALSAALPINDRNRQEIVFNLIANGRDTTNLELENRIVEYVTSELPLNRALKLLVRLCHAKVNNARLRRICRAFWAKHGDAYRAVKYRTKFRTLLRHCHIGEGTDPARAEVHRWIFGRLRDADDVQHNVLLRSRILATKNLEACFELPLEIGRDIAVNCHGVTTRDFTEQFVGKRGRNGEATVEAKGRVTRKQSLIANQQAETDVDFGRFTLIELLHHGYRVRETPDAFAEIRTELLVAVDAKATAMAQRITLPKSVHVIVDNSGSVRGSDERAYHALAVIEATQRVLQAVVGVAVTCHYVGGYGNAMESAGNVGALSVSGLLTPSGETDLRSPLARALAVRPDLVIILSDGYENVAAGSVAQVLATQAVKDSGIAVVHLNPVAAAETGGLRKLAEDLPTFGLSSPQQLSMTLLLGEASANPRRLVAMFDRIENALKGDHHELARIV